MKYIEEQWDDYRVVRENVYKVTCDKDRLKEILEKLKKYKYTLEGQSIFRISSRFLKKNKYLDIICSGPDHLYDTIHPESCKITKDKERGQAIINYTYDRSLELCSVILDFISGYEKDKAFESLFDFAYDIEDFEEENYFSKEDLLEIKKLYKETLECFKFELVEVIEYNKINDGETIDGFTLQKRMYETRAI